MDTAIKQEGPEDEGRGLCEIAGLQALSQLRYCTIRTIGMKSSKQKRAAPTLLEEFKLDRS